VITLGKNMKLNVPRTLRAQTHAVYAGALGCTVREGPMPDFVAFEFNDGRHIGVFYVDPKDGLTDAQHAQAICRPSPGASSGCPMGPGRRDLDTRGHDRRAVRQGARPRVRGSCVGRGTDQ
jgi:hypothetical protein